MLRVESVSSPAWVCLRTRADCETGVDSPASHKYNLSQLKVLRSLEVGGRASNLGPTRYIIVMEVFSTITSPVFSKLAILIRGDEAVRLLSDITLFETLHAMNEVRPFKLVIFLTPHPPSLAEDFTMDGGIGLLVGYSLHIRHTIALNLAEL